MFPKNLLSLMEIEQRQRQRQKQRPENSLVLQDAKEIESALIETGIEFNYDHEFCKLTLPDDCRFERDSHRLYLINRWNEIIYEEGPQSYTSAFTGQTYKYTYPYILRSDVIKIANRLWKMDGSPKDKSTNDYRDEARQIARIKLASL